MAHSWNIEPLTLDLKYTWKISRNASDQKTNLIVTIRSGNHAGRGEAAPNIRYAESAEAGLEAFTRFMKYADGINSIESLQDAIRQARLFRSLAFAIESAWFNLEESKTGKTFFEITSSPMPESIGTSYTIPIMDIGKMKSFYEENRLNRFPSIKLKVNADNALESLTHLFSFSDSPVMIDPNESFTDVEQCIYLLEKVARKPILLVEQPMPSAMIEETEYLKRYSGFPLFADEAITDDADFVALKGSYDGVNIKLMKAGGMLNGLRLLREARHHGMKTMVGCMVETTLGISSAMKLCGLADYADLDSFMLLKEEPFGLVNETNGYLSFVKGI